MANPLRLSIFPHQMRGWAAKARAQRDCKTEALVAWLRYVVKPDGKWSDERVILFTEYRATQNWLNEVLVAEGLATGERLMTLYGGTGNVFGAAFSPDDRHVATAVGDGTARLYTVDMEELIALAHERVTRELTDEECQIYLHTEQCAD